MILFGFRHMQAGGGAEKNLIDVALHTARRHPVGFWLAGGEIDPRLPAAGPIFRMPSGGRIAGLPLDLIRLAGVILRQRVRVMHAHERLSAFQGALLRRVLPFRLLTTVHNRFPTRAALSLWGDRALAVSDDIARWVREDCGVAPERVRVVHNGVAAPPVFDAAQRAALRRDCGVPEGHVLLCSVARLQPQKNHALLIDALARLADRPWTLLLVGEGELREALMQQARDRGLADRIRFLGLRRDVPLILQASDAFVLSSAWEGFPYVVIEALANGLPLAATDVGGVREGVIDGHTGLLVPPADPAALAQAIDRLIGDAVLRRRLGEQGRALFEQRFEIGAMLRTIDAEIDAQLLRRSGPPAEAPETIASSTEPR